MAWDPNEKGTYANLTKTAFEHGGPDQYIDDIYNGGYQDGHDKGVLDGVVVTVLTTIGTAAVGWVTKHLVDKHNAKKQELKEKSVAAEEAIRQICEEAPDDTQSNDSHIDDE